MNVREELEKLVDIDYKEFHKKLILDYDEVLGVRAEHLRKIAKLLAKENNISYLYEPHHSHEEKVIHGMLVGFLKIDYDEYIKYLDTLLPYITNWAICDMSVGAMKIADKEYERLFSKLVEYTKTNDEYTIRFGLIMMLGWYINKQRKQYIDIIFSRCDEIKHEGYYVKMAKAWLIATAYVKFKDETLQYLQKCELDDWTYNKAISKMTESFRISNEEKEQLKSMKRRKVNE